MANVKPTQAQIEAALNFINGIAAMTKASDRGLTEADVRTPDHRKYLFNFHERVIDEARKAKTALTAAAQVEELVIIPGISPSAETVAAWGASVGDYKPIYDSPNNRVRAAVNATIERCALEAAAAIRKLKDKPSAPPDDDRIFPRGP